MRLFALGFVSLVHASQDFSQVLLKFDPACSRDGDFLLEEYIENQLQAAQTRRRLSAVDGDDDIVTSIDPTSFKQLLATQLQAEKTITTRRADHVLRTRANNGKQRKVALRSGVRNLKNTETTDREDEILSALHLMAASAIAGNETNPEELLSAERAGRVSDIVNIARKNKKLQTAGLEEKLAQRSNMEQIVAEPRSLEFLAGIKIIENPILAEHLLDLANMLPCLDVAPMPNEIIPEELDEPSDNEVDEPAVKEQRAVGDYAEMDLLDYDTLMLRMKEEEANGLQAPSYARLPGDDRQLFLRWPTDEIFDKAWQLHTFWDRGRFTQHAGVAAESAWAMLLRDELIKQQPELANASRVDVDVAGLKSLDYSIRVGVVDSGCARSPDLVNQFWRNPDVCPCADNTTFAGTGEKPEGASYWNDCIGFDFGNKQPDPTMPISQHGTKCSGLIAAEVDNGYATAGVCPFCKIVCTGAAHPGGGVSGSALLEAWDYLVAKGVKIISNSWGSYPRLSSLSGSLFYSAALAMADRGHLIVASAGNLGCDVGVNCQQGTFHSPSGLPVKNIISVAGLTTGGHVNSSSNYGSRVHVFAPGSYTRTVTGPDSMGDFSGTSAAAPMVSGIAAALWAAKPHLTMEQVRESILKSGMPLAELHGKAEEPRTVDLHRALAYASQF